jgi:hypothetical protein
VADVQIEFDTALYLPPTHWVTLRTSASGWTDSGDGGWNGNNYYWTFPIDANAPPVEFKFVLDGSHWMAGENQVADPNQPIMAYNDGSVRFEP